MKASAIDHSAEKPYIDLLTGHKRIKLDANKSVLARKLDYLRNADGVHMRKMLQSYAGLDKKYLMDGAWAGVETLKIKEESTGPVLEKQNSIS